MLVCFCLQGCTDNRGRYWLRLVTVRRSADGLLSSHYSDLSYSLARRLADKLCDRYGIEDRAGLYAGVIMSVRPLRDVLADSHA